MGGEIRGRSGEGGGGRKGVGRLVSTRAKLAGDDLVGLILESSHGIGDGEEEQGEQEEQEEQEEQGEGARPAAAAVATRT